MGGRTDCASPESSRKELREGIRADMVGRWREIHRDESTVGCYVIDGIASTASEYSASVYDKRQREREMKRMRKGERE